MNQVILVDENDREIGTEEKFKVHREGKLHRAFSIFVFNSKGELLLQKRAESKYHSGGLWSNTCCSHPQPGEVLKHAAKQRLKEEMGIESELKEIFRFTFKVKLGNLIEYEIDHVFVGKFDGEPKLNREEAEDWQWVSMKELKEDINRNPDKYTFWFKEILKNYAHYF